MKLILPDTYIFNGKFYGPGEVEIEDEEAHKALKAKIDAADRLKAATPAPLTDAEASQQADAREAERETHAANRATEKRAR